MGLLLYRIFIPVIIFAVIIFLELLLLTLLYMTESFIDTYNVHSDSQTVRALA